MNLEHADQSAFQLSVVIPSYNSAPWLPSTLAALDRALSASGIAAEIIVVDDGSSDGTHEVLRDVRSTLRAPLVVIEQKNQGRFLARWAGVSAAKSNEIMLLDSRVLIDEFSLRHVVRTRENGEGSGPWNAHAVTSSTAAMIGSFWDVPTHIFWGDYLSNPRPTMITPENFDRLPKGTTCFISDRDLFLDACRASWPDEKNAHLVSDDTQLLRFIAAATPIRIDPEFSVEYRPRETVRSFLRHSFVRGTLFVDSYAGTSALRNAILIALVLAPPLALALLVWLIASADVAGLIALVGFIAVALLTPVAIAALRGCTVRGQLSFLRYVVPFGCVFWAGLARGLIVHRKKLIGSQR